MKTRVMKTKQSELRAAKEAEEKRRRNKRVRDRNYRFRLMSSKQQRVRIAKDVIEQVEAGRFRPGSLYLKLGDSSMLDGTFETESWNGRTRFVTRVLPLHEVFEQQDECEVCGLGSCFVAAVTRANAVTTADGDCENGNFQAKYLRQWFSGAQLNLIECAFEMHDKSLKRGGRSPGPEARIAAQRFGERFPFGSQQARLIAIMENIISNNGLFKP